MDDDNESVDSTEGLPVRHVIIDEDPDDDTPQTSQEPVNAYNSVKCAECVALRDNAHRAWEMVASYADKAHRLIELENQNHMLSQINDEQHTYIGEQARQLKEMKARLNEVDELRRDTEDRMRLLQSQYEQVLQKANEGRKHMEAANEWSEKYDTSQKLLLEVDALRKRYLEKYTSSLQMAADFSDKNTKAGKDIEKLRDSNTKMNAELTAFRRFFPRVFAVAKELRQCAAANPAVPAKVLRKADKVLENVIVESLALKKRPAQAVAEASAAAADEASEGIGMNSEAEFSDEDAAAEEIENLLQTCGPDSATQAHSTSANAQPSTSTNICERSSVPQTSTSGSSAQDDIGRAPAFADHVGTESSQTPRKARVAHTPKKTQPTEGQEKTDAAAALQPPAGPSAPTETLKADALESPSKQSKRARKAPLFDAHKTTAKQPPNHQHPLAQLVVERREPTTLSSDYDYVDGVMPGDFTPDSSPEKASLLVMVEQDEPTAEVVPNEASLPQATARPVTEAHEGTIGAAFTESTPLNAPEGKPTATSSEKTADVPSAPSTIPKPAEPLPGPTEAAQCFTQPSPLAPASARPVTEAHEGTIGAAFTESIPATQAALSIAEAAAENAPEGHPSATSSKKTNAVPSAALPGPTEAAQCSTQQSPLAEASTRPVIEVYEVAIGAASTGAIPATQAAVSTAEAATENAPRGQSIATSSKKTDAVPSAPSTTPKPAGPLPERREEAQSSKHVAARPGRKRSAEAILTSPFFREFDAQPLIPALEPTAFSFEQGASASPSHQEPEERAAASDNALDHLMESIDAVASVAGASTQAHSRSAANSNQATETAPHTEPSTSAQQSSAAMAPPKRVARVAGPRRPGAVPRKGAGSDQAEPEFAFQRVLTESADEAMLNNLKAAGEPVLDLDLSFMEKPKKKRTVKKPPVGKVPAKEPALVAAPARTNGKRATAKAKTDAAPATPPLPFEVRYNMPTPQPRRGRATTLLGRIASKSSSRSASSSSLPSSDPDQPSTSGIGASAAVQPQPQPSTSSAIPTEVPKLCKGRAIHTVQKASQPRAPDARRATVGVKRMMGSPPLASSASQPEAKRAKLIELPVPQRPTKGQVVKGGVAGKRPDTVVKTKPDTAAAARRAEVGSANSIVLSHFQQAAQRNLTKSVFDRVGELMKSFEAKMAETPELGALSVETLAGLMVRATIDMDVGDLWQSAKKAALADTASYETVLSKNEKVVIDFAHQLGGFDQWSNLMGAYFKKMSLEVSKALPTSSSTLKAMHFRSLTFTYLLMENEGQDEPEKKRDADGAYPTLCALVQLLVQNQPPSVAVPILCYVATIHPEFFRKAVVVKANEDTAFRRLLRLQLSDMPDKIPVVNKVIVSALGLQPAENHPYVKSPTSRELETWVVDEINRALEITEPFQKDASGGRTVSRAVLGALRPITAFLAPYFKPVLDRTMLMRQQLGRLFACLEDPEAGARLFATGDTLPESSRKLGILATVLARTLFTLLNNSKTAEKAVLQAEILPDAKKQLIDYAARYKSTMAKKPEFELLVAGLEDALGALQHY